MNTFIIQRVIFFSCKNWVEGFRKTQQRQAAIKKIAVQLGTRNLQRLSESKALGGYCTPNSCKYILVLKQIEMGKSDVPICEPERGQGKTFLLPTCKTKSWFCMERLVTNYSV